MNNQNEIPANAGNQPTTHETPAAWRPVVEIPTEPATIETPVKNSDGCFPGCCPSPLNPHE
jgi:hypothetical protein